MGNFDKITSLKNLPPGKTMLSYLKEAARLNEENIKVVRSKPAIKKEAATLEDLWPPLKKTPKQRHHSTLLAPPIKRIHYRINEAKTATTRNEQLETSIEWLTEGNSETGNRKEKKNERGLPTSSNAPVH